MTKTQTVEVEVEIEIDDVLEYVEYYIDQEDANLIISELETQNFLHKKIDGIYQETLTSDCWEDRDKIAFIKTIFKKYTLEQLQDKLS